jgi:tetratricopeptide (TPR) repeat protein
MLAVLRSPTPRRAGVLGLMLGLAMLTKFTGIVVVVGALGTLGVRALWRGDWQRDGRAAAIAGVVMLVVCGWFYARNVAVYGTPFKMSRESFMLQRYEHIQTRGQRGILEYVLFDPMILRRPEWPRGVPLAGDRFPGVPYSALRESVLTGVYANTWFEGYGGWVFPKMNQDEAVRRSGQLLLTLGLVPSILMLIGIWQAVVRLRRHGWDDTLVAMLLTFGAMMAILVQGTRAVPIHAAVKATYLMPVSVVFSFWFALGAEWLGRTRPSWLKPVVAACAVLAVASSVVFLQNRFIATYWLDEWRDSPPWQNLYGVVYYAGGDTPRARESFEKAAQSDYHLGYENLATLALDDDRPLEALHLLRRAARIQPTQTIGTPADQAQFNLLTRAEYLNTMAVIYHRLGWHRAALAAAQEAVASDPTMPEAAYDLALLKLISATTGSGPAEARWRTAFRMQSRALLSEVIARDPAFGEARTLTSTLDALNGNCPAAVAMFGEARARRGDLRQYPIFTGVGDMHAAAVRRRRHIEDLPDALRPEPPLERCRQEHRDHAA